MRTWKFVVLACVGLALVGCRTDPAIVLLERDNFKKERQIDQLKWRIQDLEEALQSANAPGPAAPRTTPQSEAAGESGPELERPAAGSPIEARPGTRTVPEKPRQRKPAGDAIPPPDTFQPIPIPKIEIPGEPVRPDAKPDQPQSSRDRSTRVIPAAVALADNTRVAQVTLNKSLTGGWNSADRSADSDVVASHDVVAGLRPSHVADDGLLVVVEPRDMRGIILDAPGNINVVLLDPTATGEAARVARWDFSATETTGMLRGGPDRGIHLNLVWPSRPLAHGKLNLFVRYTTRDGRKLQTEQPLAVSLAGTRPAEWQPMKERPVEEPAPVRTASRLAEPAEHRPVWSPDRD